MTKGQSLQDPFLNLLRRERIPVAIYTVNGIKLQGTIESFDQFVVLLRNHVSQMVYKHAISTVLPSRNVRVGGGYEGYDHDGPQQPYERPPRPQHYERALPSQPYERAPHAQQYEHHAQQYERVPQRYAESEPQNGD